MTTSIRSLSRYSSQIAEFSYKPRTTIKKDDKNKIIEDNFSDVSKDFLDEFKNKSLEACLNVQAAENYLSHYTMLGYSSINQDIRRNPYNPNKWKSETQGTVRVLNEVLKKIPPLQENILLMRILILGNSKLTVSDIAEKLNEGDILRENQLVSTSLPIMGRTPFVKICDNTTFKLKTTPEVKGVWLGKKTDETKGISSMPNENEILLPVGTKYQIKSIKVKPPEGFSMEKKLEIEADLLPPSP